MRRKTLKRQRKQRGGHPDDADDADNPDNVRKGLDALVTYFLWKTETKNENGYNAEWDFLKYGEIFR